ncbi:hypothetical protein ES705_37884 [subsurface metagenome]
MKAKDFILGLTSFTCIICTNILAFIYDNGWIDVAISLNSLLLGAIIVDYYLSHKNNDK